MSISYRIIISCQFFLITNFNIHLFHSNKYYFTSVCSIHKIVFSKTVRHSVHPFLKSNLVKVYNRLDDYLIVKKSVMRLETSL